MIVHVPACLILVRGACYPATHESFFEEEAIQYHFHLSFLKSPHLLRRCALCLGIMPPKKPKKKRAPLKRAIEEDPDDDDDEREDPDDDCEESAVRYGQIPEMFRLEEEEVSTQDFEVTTKTLKSSRTMPAISRSRSVLRDNVICSEQCNPHLMNRFGLVSWYVFLQYCAVGMDKEVLKLKEENGKLKELEVKNKELNDLITSLRGSLSNKLSISEMMNFKTTVVANIICPHAMREILFCIGFPATQASSNLFFSLFIYLSTHVSLPHTPIHNRSCPTHRIPRPSLPGELITGHLLQRRFLI